MRGINGENESWGAGIVILTVLVMECRKAML